MLQKCVVNFGGGGAVLKCGEPIRGSAGRNLSGIPDSSRVDIGQKLRPVDSFGRLDSLEICVLSHTGQGRRGLILSHETGGMVMDAS